MLAEHARNCAALRERDIPTVPSSIEVECAINPFLRWDSDEIIANLVENRQLDSRTPADVFAAVQVVGRTRADSQVVQTLGDHVKCYSGEI